MKSFLAGAGTFESLLLERVLPQIKHVIAVEPDVQFNDTITRALQPFNDRPLKVSATVNFFPKCI